MTKVITNPGLLAMQAKTRESIEAAIREIDEDRKADLAEIVNGAEGEAITVEEAMAALDKAD